MIKAFIGEWAPWFRFVSFSPAGVGTLVELWRRVLQKSDALEKNLQKLLLKKEVHKNQLEEKEDLQEWAGEQALRKRKTSRRSSLKRRKLPEDAE